MLMIRLQRVGRKNDPSFRVIVVDARRAAKTGQVIEVVGSYDARKGTPQLSGEKIKAWIAKGAQVSPTVHNLLVKQKIITGQAVSLVPIKKIVAATPSAEAVAAPAEVTATAEAPSSPAEEPAPSAEEVPVPEEAAVAEATPEEVPLAA